MVILLKDQIKTKKNGCGMLIDGIKDPIIEFLVHVIVQKFYQSTILNSVTCVAIDLGHKIVKKDHTYDITKL